MLAVLLPLFELALALILRALGWLWLAQTARGLVQSPALLPPLLSVLLQLLGSTLPSMHSILYLL